MGNLNQIEPLEHQQDSETPRRAVHGRRHGRRLRSGLKALMKDLFPQLSFSLPPPGACLHPASLFSSKPCEAPEVPRRPKAIWLEIGFGGGEHLAWQARNHPEVGMLGVEYFVNGIASLLRRVDEGNIGNLRIHQGDGRDVLAALPEACIERVFLLFPDPWPKTRHHKRRFIQQVTLDRLAMVMADGVELRLATDDMDYLKWILERMVRHPDFEWLARGPADWRTRPSDWPPTRYERKALKQGLQPAYLRFRRRPRRVSCP